MPLASWLHILTSLVTHTRRWRIMFSQLWSVLVSHNIVRLEERVQCNLYLDAKFVETTSLWFVSYKASTVQPTHASVISWACATRKCVICTLPYHSSGICHSQNLICNEYEGYLSTSIVCMRNDSHNQYCHHDHSSFTMWFFLPLVSTACRLHQRLYCTSSICAVAYLATRTCNASGRIYALWSKSSNSPMTCAEQWESVR